MEKKQSNSQDKFKQLYYRNVVANLETKVKDNSFKNKEELNEYLNELKKNPIASTLISNEEILKLLNLYDEYHQKIPESLDMQNYKDAKLGDDKYIIAVQNDSVLKNMNSTEITEEFKQKQNELASANTTNELANADIVYDQMKKNEKEELKFLPIDEVTVRPNINTEVLNKIKFFVTNQNIEPHVYRVNIETGVLYNPETDELYEVRKNPETGEYEIFKGGEKQYTTNEQPKNEEDNQELIHDKDEEKLEYENNKVKRLIKPPENAAFVNNTFIIFIITIFSVLAALIAALVILTNK